MDNLADNVARLCVEKYTLLREASKPNAREWTVLSGVVMRNADGVLSVVALATGTKCLGDSELLKSTREEAGSRLSDSHAEVLARRAFIRYLYDQTDLTLSGRESAIFSRTDREKLDLNNEVSFHFFSSQTPCGDCSILPKRKTDNDHERCKIRRVDTNIITSQDVYRTGAKCVREERAQDPRLPGADYHVVGPLRTKPGRGDPTSSLSCSDKMAKWLVLGLQGSLLSLIIPPIKLSSVTIGGDCPFSLDAMERGLYKRFNTKLARLDIFQAKTAFAHKKGQERSYPCPVSIIWCAARHSPLELAVAGRKQGLTKKRRGNNLLLVTRRMLLQSFLQIFDKHRNYYGEIRHPKKMTYYDWKQWSITYQNKWKQLKCESFLNWPCKSIHLQRFAL
ncbi:PREDICTED: tRNA-specific adenosine deaminase 1 [Vollenhovia emeryi]|uniref:tRNA-specific adenosine deaminase 1 n=1 Tax=Vollenhovia emeryi TaxID=411798 RepID=UPI0005F3D33C|nr:PREDICTED: tRNA-specific adenosine deaminase 1 [Vollenhovia emeryi]